MKTIYVNLEGIINSLISKQASDFHVGFRAGSNVPGLFSHQ